MKQVFFQQMLVLFLSLLPKHKQRCRCGHTSAQTGGQTIGHTSVQTDEQTGGQTTGQMPLSLKSQ